MTEAKTKPAPGMVIEIYGSGELKRYQVVDAGGKLMTVYVDGEWYVVRVVELR